MVQFTEDWMTYMTDAETKNPPIMTISISKMMVACMALTFCFGDIINPFGELYAQKIRNDNDPEQIYQFFFDRHSACSGPGIPIGSIGMKVGVIADDFTGATDIAGFLVENGLRTIQLLGVPRGEVEGQAQADAFVVSLKSRSCPVSEAVAASQEALTWLQGAGCTQFFFKYCSTFDSTAEGNIGPVADTLLEKLGESFTVVCPSLPVNGRTVYQGYLFVHDELLHESGMRNHPVTPMGDSKLQRLLSPQTTGTVTDIHADVIDRGAETLRARLAEAKAQGFRYAVLDTVRDDQLETIARAVADFVFVTGASGLGGALAAVHAGRSAAAPTNKGRPRPGPTVVLSGSCSVATNRQVERYRSLAASRYVDPRRCVEDGDYVEELLTWTREHFSDEWACMLYATSPPERLAETQAEFGRSVVGNAIESTLGELARRLMDEGVTNFIVAGGETSGRVVQSLGLEAFHIGPQIAPGVPWTRATDRDVYLALKSGNFGSDDFFAHAQEFFHD